MHKLDISASTDYVNGCLKYGHYEGVIYLNDKEFEEFEKNPTEFLNKNKKNFYLHFIVDKYKIEDVGMICDVDYKEQPNRYEVEFEAFKRSLARILDKDKKDIDDDNY